MTVTSATARMASAIVLMFALVRVGTCQTTTAEDSAAESSETVEEIIVYGERSLIHLRQEVYAAEENFFAVFNLLNSDDEFDVECDYVFSITAHRRLRTCKAKFLMKYERDVYLEWIPNLARLRRKEKQLVEEMQTQVAEHPELLEVFIEMAKTKQNYESERQSRRRK